jgi:hypothetical protein
LGLPAAGLALCMLVAFAARPAVATPGCAQAQAIVEQVRSMYKAGQPDHRQVLGRLNTAHDLCPTLGDAWKYSYCSATALNDPKARYYKDRALFNGVTSLECGDRPAAAAASQRPLPGYVHEKYALIIGIGKFKDPQIPRLQFAAKDAADLAALLKDPEVGRFKPENVILLTDKDATRANILNQLQRLFLSVHEDDLVLMYVSSHGSQKQSEKGLQGIGYIVTYDTMTESIWVDALDYQGFSERAAMLKARRKVVFLDTCFSGQASSGAKDLVPEVNVDARTARLFLSGEGTYVITSSKDDERSYESGALRNSYFTYFLMEGLKRGAEPASLKDLFDFISRRVPASVADEKRALQHPQMVPTDGLADLKIGVIPRGGPGSD